MLALLRQPAQLFGGLVNTPTQSPRIADHAVLEGA